MLLSSDACQSRDIMLDLIRDSDLLDAFFDIVQLLMREDVLDMSAIFFLQSI